MVDFQHVSVLPEEVIAYLEPRPSGIYVDGTLGGAGHARLILEASAPDGVLVGFDQDEEAMTTAAERLAPYGNRVILVRKNFAYLQEALSERGIESIDGFLLDVGVSSHQLDTVERGFSFQHNAPLDMRMDTGSETSAAELVNTVPEEELARLIWEFGEERWAKRIAAFIVKRRLEAPINTTLELVDVIKGAVPKGAWEERLHPATRTFQALRIAVNDELGNLEKGLSAGIRLLKKGGRGVVISFHSLEDRIVKTSFRVLAQGCRCPKELPRCVCGNQPQVKVLTGKPVVATETEVSANPRSRSAKLRAVVKI